MLPAPIPARSAASCTPPALPAPFSPAAPIARAAIVLGLAFSLGLTFGLVPSGRIARACTCPTPRPPADVLQSSTAVFDGTVVGIEMVDPRDQSSELRVSFVVHTQWKGVTSGRLTLTTPGNSAMCGIRFGLGLRYLVYANGVSDRLTVWSCSRTRGYDATEAAALGPDTPPPGAEPYAGKWSQTAPPAPCPRCAAPPAPREALAAAAAVFHGRPFGIRYLGPDGDFDRVVTFLNFGWWKGPSTPTIEVRVPWNVWSCDQPFGETGGVGRADDYLIYADAAADGSLTLKLCDRTKPYDAAEAAELGTPNPPRPGQATGTPTPPAMPSPGTDTPQPSGTPTPTLTPAPCPTLECPPCAGPRPAADWLAESDAVFHGRVTAIEPVGCDHRVHFAVDTVWKGTPVAQRLVWINSMAWQCTRRFEVDEEAVVFAKADGSGDLWLPLCFGIVNGDPRAALGRGTRVGPGGSETPTPTPGWTATNTPIATSAPPPGRVYLPWLGTTAAAGGRAP